MRGQRKDLQFHGTRPSHVGHDRAATVWELAVCQAVMEALSRAHSHVIFSANPSGGWLSACSLEAEPELGILCELFGSGVLQEKTFRK